MKILSTLTISMMAVCAFAQFGGGTTPDYTLSTSYVNLGGSGSPIFSGSFTITNTGSTSLNYWTYESASDMSLSPRNGTLSIGASRTIFINVTASRPGTQTHSITVGGMFGAPTKTVTVTWDWIFPKRAVEIFKDNNLFEAVMFQADADGNGKLSHAEREAVTELRLNGLGVEDFSGIEIFFNLRYLDVSDNQIAVMPNLSELNQLLIFKANNNALSTVPKLADSVKFVELNNSSL